jgi:hypothetical protein
VAAEALPQPAREEGGQSPRLPGVEAAHVGLFAQRRPEAPKLTPLDPERGRAGAEHDAHQGRAQPEHPACEQPQGHEVIGGVEAPAADLTRRAPRRDGRGVV